MSDELGVGGVDGAPDLIEEAEERRYLGPLPQPRLSDHRETPAPVGLERLQDLLAPQPGDGAVIRGHRRTGGPS